MDNVSRTVLSQFANSPVLLSLINSMNDSIDPAADIETFYRSIWSIDSANSHGLDIWGRIVGVTRLLKVVQAVDYFGFKTGSAPEDWTPFGEGTFYVGHPVTNTYEMPDEAYRSLILFKAFSNITACTIPNLNRLLNSLFAGTDGGPLTLYGVPGYRVEGYLANARAGRAWVEDLGNMQLRYVFAYTLTNVETAIVNTPGLLPHPTGVQVFIG